jgi:hypothetical protein
MPRTNKRNFSNRAQRRSTRQRRRANRANRANRTTTTRRQPSRVSRGGRHYGDEELETEDASMTTLNVNADSLLGRHIVINGEGGKVTSMTENKIFMSRNTFTVLVHFDNEMRLSYDNKLGLHMVKEDKDKFFYIETVSNNGPSADNGLKAGDMLVSVQGKDSKMLPLDSLATSDELVDQLQKLVRPVTAVFRRIQDKYFVLSTKRGDGNTSFQIVKHNDLQVNPLLVTIPSATAVLN